MFSRFYEVRQRIVAGFPVVVRRSPIAHGHLRAGGVVGDLYWLRPSSIDVLASGFLPLGCGYGAIGTLELLENR
jgi:hypothetical protein